MSIYILLQETVMIKSYGRADSHALSTIAIYHTVQGRALISETILLTITFMLLVTVQFARSNISFPGRLKKPVPMLPYITIAFILTGALFQTGILPPSP